MRNLPLRISIFILFIVMFFAGLALGYYITYYTLPLIFKPTIRAIPLIGVISIYGYMISDYDKELYINSILYAYLNNSITGIVLRVDSPGGYASIVEDIYNALKKLNSIKPVVTIIEGLAASGGYYVCLGSREIYSTPTSLIGNIGLIMSQPYLVIPSEAIIETGPYKYTGFSLKEVPFIVKKALDNFINAIKSSRGLKLNTTMEELSLGKLYIANDAIKLGLIDGFSSFIEVVDRVAKIAGIVEYRIIDLTEMFKKNIQSLGGELWSKGEFLSIELLSKLQPEPLGIYYLSPYYIKAYRFMGENTISNTPTNIISNYNPTGEEVVFVDISHRNLFIYEILGALWGKLIENNIKILFTDIQSLQNFMMTIGIPKALLIICPSSPFTPHEINIIKNYVSNGGKLLMIYDPSIVSSIYINMLAQEYGMHFSDGYLYDLKYNYGIYRNIVLKNFTNHPLTSNITELILFTAAQVYGGKEKLAYTFNTTYLSLLDVRNVYTPIAINGNVIAIGDLTFLLDPFHDIGDNKNFLENLVKFIKG
ncbi:MAG: S49 family peptidase [Candidatus Methanomethylicia archaeon]